MKCLSLRNKKAKLHVQYLNSHWCNLINYFGGALIQAISSCLFFCCCSSWKIHKWSQCVLVPDSVRQGVLGVNEACGRGLQTRGKDVLRNFSFGLLACWISQTSVMLCLPSSPWIEVNPNLHELFLNPSRVISWLIAQSYLAPLWVQLSICWLNMS